MEVVANLSMADTRMSIESLDLAALAEAVDVVWRHPERRRELRSLIRKRGWEAAARIAAYDVQCRSLNLKPWQEPPCTGRLRDDKSPAGCLLKRMAKRGVSRWAPDPLRAIAQASPVVRTQRQHLGRTGRELEEATTSPEPAPAA
jgi:hypothetical protein